MEEEFREKIIELERMMEKVVLKDHDDFINNFEEKIKLLGFNSYRGNIIVAGAVSDGKYQVQFMDSNNSWSSRWPKWAFDIAIQAITNDKRVWIISNGPPFGDNIQQVLIITV